MRQYELGKAFCDAVAAEAGIEGLNRVWPARRRCRARRARGPRVARRLAEPVSAYDSIPRFQAVSPPSRSCRCNPWELQTGVRPATCRTTLEIRNLRKHTQPRGYAERKHMPATAPRAAPRPARRTTPVTRASTPRHKTATAQRQGREEGAAKAVDNAVSYVTETAERAVDVPVGAVPSRSPSRVTRGRSSRSPPASPREGAEGHSHAGRARAEQARASRRARPVARSRPASGAPATGSSASSSRPRKAEKAVKTRRTQVEKTVKDNRAGREGRQGRPDDRPGARQRLV